MNTVTRGQIVGVGVAACVALGLVDLLVGPPAHDVHSFGGSALTVATYPSDLQGDFYWRPEPPTENLAAVECAHQRAGAAPCASLDIVSRFADLKQAKQTLYYVWRGCPARYARYGYGSGQNFEFFAASRTLVMHCYMATGWFYVRPNPGEVEPGYAPVLLAIPTAEMGDGVLRIHEDDRYEHWTGDASYESELTTTTIS